MRYWTWPMSKRETRARTSEGFARPGPLICVSGFLAFVAFSGALEAEPFTPEYEHQVLERLPASNQKLSSELAQLQSSLSRRPSDLQLATELARRYLKMGRERADPRYAGYAQAALQPWWDQPEPPTEVLVLRAILRQRRHAFEAALADLNRALARNPSHAQARLSRASLYELRGDYEAAMDDCLLVARTAPSLVGTACQASVAARRGRAADGFEALQQQLARNIAQANSVWARTVLADIAVQLGRHDAERYIKQALTRSPEDPYLLAVYADFLSAHQRFDEVQGLLANRTQVDALLLRLTMAEAALAETGKQDGKRDAARLREQMAELAARFEAGRRRGDTVHLREEAIYQLHLQNDPNTALTLAQQNWDKQREPADAIILLQASLAVVSERTDAENITTENTARQENAKQCAQSLIAWLQAKGLEHVQLERLVERARELGWTKA